MKLFIRLGFVTAFSAGLIALFLGQVASAQRRIALRFGVIPATSGQFYVEGPKEWARDVFFEGETVHLEVTVGNPTPTSQVLMTGSGPIELAFAVRPRQGSDALELTISPNGKASGSGRSYEVPWGGDIQMEPQSSITWPATFVPRGQPGVYEWQVSPLTLRSSIPILNAGGLLRYELRQVTTFADRAELARRKMMTTLYLGDESGAERAAGELLALYPASSTAHIVLSDLCIAARRIEEARTHLAEAARLLSGPDYLQLARMSDASAHEAVQSLQTQIVTLR